jgi:hypothetical protein
MDPILEAGCSCTGAECKKGNELHDSMTRPSVSGGVGSKMSCSCLVSGPQRMQVCGQEEAIFGFQL